MPCLRNYCRSLKKTVDRMGDLGQAGQRYSYYRPVDAVHLEAALADPAVLFAEAGAV